MTTEVLMLAGYILALLVIAWAGLDALNSLLAVRSVLEAVKDKFAYAEGMLAWVEKMLVVKS